MNDLLIAGGTIVNEGQADEQDVLIRKGRIERIGPGSNLHPIAGPVSIRVPYQIAGPEGILFGLGQPVAIEILSIIVQRLNHCSFFEKIAPAIRHPKD